MQEALFLYFFKLLFVDFSFPCFVRVFSCVCVRAFSARSQQECKSTIFFFLFFLPQSYDLLLLSSCCEYQFSLTERETECEK